MSTEFIQIFHVTNLVLCIKTKATLVLEIPYHINMTCSCSPQQRLLSMLDEHRKLHFYSVHIINKSHCDEILHTSFCTAVYMLLPESNPIQSKVKIMTVAIIEFE